MSIFVIHSTHELHQLKKALPLLRASITLHRHYALPAGRLGLYAQRLIPYQPGADRRDPGVGTGRVHRPIS